MCPTPHENLILPLSKILEHPQGCTFSNVNVIVDVDPSLADHRYHWTNGCRFFASIEDLVHSRIDGLELPDPALPLALGRTRKLVTA